MGKEGSDKAEEKRKTRNSSTSESVTSHILTAEFSRSQRVLIEHSNNHERCVEN
jgi:hypothetical protein